jgi:hypothetical protein
MKHIISFTLCMFVAHASYALEQTQDCFDELPGEKAIAFDTPGKIKITEVLINEKGSKALIATEYLGSPNLQASVYLIKDNRYCFSGDLGPATKFASNPRVRSAGFYELSVESKSGSDKFYRAFHYQKGTYALVSCKVKPAHARIRKCTDSEK